MIQDKSIDFVFSFDSLVHAEAEVIEAYLNQLAMKLQPKWYWVYSSLEPREIPTGFLAHR